VDFKYFFIKLKSKLIPTSLTSDEFCYLLRSDGIEIGKGTTFFNSSAITIDTQRPWMIKIGEYCKITSGVVILQHDYSRSVLRRVYGDIISEAGKTVIGNNVFIGMNSIILMGSKIGNNSIIGAGSVVNGAIPDNCVVAGNPARVICTLDQYYNKRKNKYVDEAKVCAQEFRKEYKRIPTITEMGAFFPLYLDRNLDKIREHHLKTNLSGDNEQEILEDFLKSKPVYASYDKFIEDAFKES